MKRPYRGETLFKSVSRSLVWWQHKRLLGRAFKTTPHVFLASDFAGDATTLASMGVQPLRIWAVEQDHQQCRALAPRVKAESFRLFPRQIESVIEDFAQSENIRSVYLDYCGNLEGTSKSTARVVSQLPVSSVVSITLFLGREQFVPEDRETMLLRGLRCASRHPVTLMQSITYLSTNLDPRKGSRMSTWTFYIGRGASRSKMRFDLTRCSPELAKSETEVEMLWTQQFNLAKARSRAAIQANVTRRE